MATEERKQQSVILKEPMQVIEVPDKKIIAVEDLDSTRSNKLFESDKKQDEPKDMDISMESNDDVMIAPNNQT